MKATLAFDLNDPDDTTEHHIATHARDMLMCLWDFDQHLRDKIKYHNAGQEIENLRAVLCEMMCDRGVHLDELVR